MWVITVPPSYGPALKLYWKLTAQLRILAAWVKLAYAKDCTFTRVERREL